jgi:hypothetical protein
MSSEPASPFGLVGCRISVSFAEILERVNAELAGEDISEIVRVIMSLRMTRAISSHKWSTYSGCGQSDAAAGARTSVMEGTGG